MKDNGDFVVSNGPDSFKHGSPPHTVTGHSVKESVSEWLGEENMRESDCRAPIKCFGTLALGAAQEISHSTEGQ